MCESGIQKDALLLVLQVKKGDKSAFSQLYRSHYPRIFSFLRTLLKDSFMAEEITQDVFFRLWINREKLDHTLPLDPYLFSMAKNTVLNFQKRKETEERYLEYQHKEEQAEEQIEQALYGKELQNLINAAIKTMPAQQQKIFRLSREEGLLNAEIAEKLQISKRTVEKHISNSLSQLREVISKNYLLCFFL